MICVMIIEDDPMVAEINRRHLQTDRRIDSVVLCQDGDRAWERLRKSPADLVLLDVHIPGTDGFTLLRRLRGAGIKTEAILITAANDRNSLDEAMRLGALDYLIKPFEYERFRAALERFFRKRELSGNGDGVFSQEEADRLFSIGAMGNPAEVPEKGIYPRTLERISAFFLARQQEHYSCGEVAQQLGLSRVTVHKYLRYMEQRWWLNSEVDYKTEGRPCVRYFMEGGGELPGMRFAGVQKGNYVYF